MNFVREKTKFKELLERQFKEQSKTAGVDIVETTLRRYNPTLVQTLETLDRFSTGSHQKGAGSQRAGGEYESRRHSAQFSQLSTRAQQPLLDGPSPRRFGIGVSPPPLGGHRCQEDYFRTFRCRLA